MKKLVNLSPNSIGYVEEFAIKKFGENTKKFSMALEFIIDEHRGKNEKK